MPLIPPVEDGTGDALARPQAASMNATAMNATHARRLMPLRRSAPSERSAGGYDPAMIDDFRRFEALTFDCYGTLIDWETGLTNAFLPIFRGRGVEAPANRVLERFAVHETAAEAGPYRRYRDVLARRPSRRDHRVRRRADCRRDRGVLGFGGRVAGIQRYDRSPCPAEGALQARRHHQLRRRPVRRIAAAARRGVRLGGDRPAGRAHTNRARATSRWPSSGSASRATGSCMSPRASSTTMLRPSAWA